MRNTLLVLLAMLATSTLTATTHQNRELLGISSVSWNSLNLGEYLGAIWKMSILICLILLIVDAIQRFGGKKLGVSHSVRFIWFIYGTAAVYFIGATVPQGYRVFNGTIFSKFLEEIFDGYFGSGRMDIFGNPITIGGTKQTDGTALIQNALFFELIIFIGLRIANLATASGLKQGNPLSNLLGSLRRIVGLFLALFNLFFALSWYQYMHAIGKLGDVDKRASFNVWLSWLLAFYVNAESLWSIVEVALHAAGAKGSNTKNYSEAANPAAGNATQQSYESFIDEVAYMHQVKKSAIMTPIGQFYNVAFLARWALTIFFAATWFNKPRTMYWIVIIMDLALVVLTVIALNTFNKPSGILILISEVLTFLRHLVQLFNFMDQAGSGEMSQFLVDLFTHIAFWGYIFSTLIEFTLLFAPLFSSGSSSAQENANSEDVRLDLESNNELGNKINTYKSMKSGKVTNNAPAQGQNAPGQPMPGQHMPGQTMPGQTMPGQPMPQQPKQVYQA